MKSSGFARVILPVRTDVLLVGCSKGLFSMLFLNLPRGLS